LRAARRSSENAARGRMPRGGIMNKNFFIAWIVVFVAWMAGSFLVHGVLLHEGYAQLPNLFRSEADAQKYFPLMLLAHLLMAGAFAWIYSRGIEAGSWLAQGIRFGVAVALLMTVPMYTIYYVVQPLPGMHVVKQAVFDSILVVLLGVIVAFVYRPRAAA
jgi:magnesium-transporting ATPase (P-type)